MGRGRLESTVTAGKINGKGGGPKRKNDDGQYKVVAQLKKKKPSG